MDGLCQPESEAMCVHWQAKTRARNASDFASAAEGGMRGGGFYI